MKPVLRAAWLAVALLGAGCATTSTVRDTPASPSPGHSRSGAEAHDNLNAVLWTQVSAEYGATTRSIYGAATDLLDRALADRRWDALPREERAGQRVEHLLPAIILDADETVIDNSPYQARLIERGERFQRETWESWVQERSAKPVPGALEFLRAAAQRGITVFYVTNRDAVDKRATEENLRALGFPMSDPEDVVLTINEDQGFGREKASRRRFIGEQYRVLMVFGDNLGDFVAGTRTGNDVRAGIADSYRDWWGSRWFMLPNPMYGGWESALLGDSEDHSRSRRRALRTR